MTEKLIHSHQLDDAAAEEALARAFTQRARTGEHPASSDFYKQLGATPVSARLAAAAYREFVENPTGAGIVAFALPYSWGMHTGVERVALALSDPRSRGVEREIVKRLLDGAEIEDAIRGAQRPAEPVGPIEAGVNVVPLRK